MAELTKGLLTVFEFLKEHDEGDVVSEAAVLKATGWKPSTLSTYVKKNKLAGFLAKRADGRFEVLRKGSTLKEADIAGALTQVTPDATRFAPGEKLKGEHGQYQLERERGRGATAHVWKATKLKSEESVAIKIVNPRPDLLDPAVFSDLCRRFKRESSNGSKINHECVVRHLDYGTYRSRPFLVMEMAERSVKDVLERSGAIPNKDAALIVQRCLLALQHLHETGSIHRDVKPANMLLTARGVVLADLGIVKWGDLNPEFTSAGTITTAAVNLGSLNYMAPEQRDAPHEVDGASDIYSLGVSWYELLTNNRPSPAAFAAEQTRAPSTDKTLNSLITRMTKYSRTDRPSVAEVLHFVTNKLS